MESRTSEGVREASRLVALTVEDLLSYYFSRFRISNLDAFGAKVIMQFAAIVTQTSVDEVRSIAEEVLRSRKMTTKAKILSATMDEMLAVVQVSQGNLRMGVREYAFAKEVLREFVEV